MAVRPEYRKSRVAARLMALAWKVCRHRGFDLALISIAHGLSDGFDDVRLSVRVAHKYTQARYAIAMAVNCLPTEAVRKTELGDRAMPYSRR